MNQDNYLTSCPSFMLIASSLTRIKVELNWKLTGRLPAQLAVAVFNQNQNSWIMPKVEIS